MVAVSSGNPRVSKVRPGRPAPPCVPKPMRHESEWTRRKSAALYLMAMKMTSERRAVDKIFKRRNRYEIPDWQREGDLWDLAKKQALIDSILRGWKLPKFYFVKTSPRSVFG